MTQTKTRWRYFLAHQDPKQEAWFEEQARQGWHLVKPGLCGFTFARGESQEARYRLDYQILRGEKRNEYLALFRDAGWEFLGESFNRYYFRALPDSLAPEIHSDPESRKDRIRRELRVLGILAALNAWNTLALGAKLHRDMVSATPSPAYMTAFDAITPALLCLTSLAALLLSWCGWKLLKALRQLR